ncbi:MAG: hypothetical protein AB1Z98_36160 [Nannocystaceae bacterium]
MRPAPLRFLLLCSLLTSACSDDGLAPAQSTDDDASVTTTSPAAEASGGDATLGADATGGGTTSGSPPSPTGTTSDETTSGRSPTDDSGPDSATTTDGSSGSDSSSGSDGSSSSSDGGQSSSSDGGMMSACPNIAGTSLIGGPADLYGFCWYLTAPMDTCDSACAELVGGANLAAMAESSYADSCSGPGPDDISTWFFDNGNPGGWTMTGAVTSAHTLGYGYSMAGTFYGKCSTGGVEVGTYPGEIVRGGLENERQIVCACALGSP